jgi:hypothetical protein
MERLSAPMRERSRRTELWLSFNSSGLMGPAAGIHLPAVQTIIVRLNEGFAPFIGLPPSRGEPWHLNTHQGRKTFARFVGKRDRTGLDALRSHFGHVSRVMTDRGYVGTDFVLDELIDRHARDETRHALEELLTAVSLGGKAGRMIAARTGFRGRTRDGSVQAYVEFLMTETDLRLGLLRLSKRNFGMSGWREGPQPGLANAERLRLLRQLRGHAETPAGVGGTACAQCQPGAVPYPRSRERDADTGEDRRMRPHPGAAGWF